MTRASDIIEKVNKLREAMNVKTASGSVFIKKLEKLADKHNCNFSYNDSRKSDSMYFDFSDRDDYEVYRVRISDHFSSDYYMTGIDKSIYVDDYKDSNAVVKEIEKGILEFKAKYPEYFS